MTAEMSSNCVAPPASEDRVRKERRCRFAASRTIEKLVRSGHGYRAKKIIEYSARHYHDYRRVSCSTTINSARREIEECIKCEKHSWDTWYDRSRSVLGLTYRPELNISQHHDHYPEELARHRCSISEGLATYYNHLPLLWGIGRDGTA